MKTWIRRLKPGVVSVLGFEGNAVRIMKVDEKRKRVFVKIYNIFGMIARISHRWVHVRELYQPWKGNGWVSTVIT